MPSLLLGAVHTSSHSSSLPSKEVWLSPSYRRGSPSQSHLLVQGHIANKRRGQGLNPELSDPALPLFPRWHPEAPLASQVHWGAMTRDFAVLPLHGVGTAPAGSPHARNLSPVPHCVLHPHATPPLRVCAPRLLHLEPRFKRSPGAVPTYCPLHECHCPSLSGYRAARPANCVCVWVDL